MQGKRFTDDVVEIEAFKVDQPGGKWLVISYYAVSSKYLGQMVKRCDTLPTKYPDIFRGDMIPIKWVNWTGESKEYRLCHAEAFLDGQSESF